MKDDLVYCKILNTNINVTNMDKTIQYLMLHLDTLRGNYICVSNVHTTVMSYNNESYRKIQNQAAMVLPDGKPLSVVSRLRGYKDAKKVSGPDLMPELFNISQLNGYRHFFYGATEETLKKLEAALSKKYPKLQIAGMYSPPFRTMTLDEDKHVIEMINESNPDFIWVGLGAPKQEIWMAAHKEKINGLMIGVGAGFDFLAGTIKRAPKWMQKCGLEWFFRLTQDPQRLWKRYLKTNIQFIWLLLRGK